MELNFFDTNLLGTLRKVMPIWDRSLYASLCIEVLHHNDRTEPVVVIAVTVVRVWIEHTSITAVVEIATTFHERNRRYSLIPIFHFLISNCLPVIYTFLCKIMCRLKGFKS